MKMENENNGEICYLFILRLLIVNVIESVFFASIDIPKNVDAQKLQEKTKCSIPWTLYRRQNNFYPTNCKRCKGC